MPSGLLTSFGAPSGVWKLPANGTSRFGRRTHASHELDHKGRRMHPYPPGMTWIYDSQEHQPLGDTVIAKYQIFVEPDPCIRRLAMFHVCCRRLPVF